MTDRSEPQEASDPQTAGPAREPIKRRVAMIAGLAALALALRPGTAKADLDFDDVEGAVGNALDDFFTPIFEIILDAIKLVDMPTPGRIRALIDEILGLAEEGGEGSYIGKDPAASMERSYPPDMVGTPEGQFEASIQRAVDTRARVDQSARINQQVALAQGELFNEETLIVEAARGTAAYGLTGILLGILEMQRNTNIRLGQMSSQVAALNQLSSDLVMLPISEREQAAMIGAEFIGGQGEEVSPPVDRPAQ